MGGGGLEGGNAWVSKCVHHFREQKTIMEGTVNHSWLNEHVDIWGLITTTFIDCTLTMYQALLWVLPLFLPSLYLHHYEVNTFYPHFTQRKLRL